MPTVRSPRRCAGPSIIREARCRRRSFATARCWSPTGCADGDSDVVTEGRIALYAKGRIRGKWLMTLAYDSDKKEAETRFGSAIDPDSYYTVYADRSERRFDAASVRKLYLKLERPQFYALFGDYETGIDEPELARYVRAF